MNCNAACTANKLKVIAHPMRLKILCHLSTQELSVQEIVIKAGSSQSNISQHLGQMRKMGILLSHRDANRVYYRIGDPQLLTIIEQLRELYCGNDEEK